ncbi:hypothetical protein [Dyella tabacisoli]|nr:hypothetical protein [Dyella tabacisoli]
MGALLTALLLTACQNPHNAVLPTDVTEFDQNTKDQLQKLTSDERTMVERYTTRHLGGAFGDPIPEGTTFAKAIEEQKIFEARQAKQTKQ